MLEEDSNVEKLLREVLQAYDCEVCEIHHWVDWWIEVLSWISLLMGGNVQDIWDARVGYYGY